MKKVVIAVLITVIIISVFAPESALGGNFGLIDPTGDKNFSVELGHEYSESEWKYLEEIKEITEKVSLVVIKKQQYLQIKYHHLATEKNEYDLIGDLSVFGRLGNARVKILGMCYWNGCADMFITDPELSGAKPYFDSKGIMFGTLGARVDFYKDKSPFSIGLSVYGTQYQDYEDVNRAKIITADPPGQFTQRLTVKKHRELVGGLMVQYKFKRKAVIYGGTELHLAEAHLQESRSVSYSSGYYDAVTYPEYTVREKVLSGNLGVMVPIYKALSLDVEVGVKFGSLFYGRMLNVALNYAF